MSVKIRLRRMGNRNNPFYRLVVTDSRSAVRGRFIESIGWYNPTTKDLSCKIDMERFSYWVDQGAQPSETVRSLAKKYAKLPAEETLAEPQEAAVPEETAPEAEETVEEVAQEDKAVEETASVSEEPASEAPEENTADGETTSAEEKVDEKPEA